MLVRRGGGDYQTTAALVRTINIGGLPALASLSTGTPQPSDQMIIARGGTSYQLPFNQVGFLQGTIMWFYLDQANKPSGWTLATGLTDCLLAVQGGSVFTSGAMGLGTWQQDGWALTSAQMNHFHYSFGSGLRSSANSASASGPNIFAYNRLPDAQVITADVNNALSGSSATAHNHGNSWRPYAAVGNLYSKDN
jgi:hypothetical protein